jgi:hypothetical protein
MNTPSDWLFRLRSASLLLAAVLHLLSIPAEPVVHGWLHAPASLPGWSADQSDTDGAQLHQEQACVICQGLNEHALPEPGAAPISAAVLLPSLPAMGEPRPTSITRAQLQARAPPA